MEASLVELKTLFESIHGLVGRCGLPESLAKRASLVMLNRVNPNKQALENAEKRLEQITHVRRSKHLIITLCAGRGGRAGVVGWYCHLDRGTA